MIEVDKIRELHPFSRLNSSEFNCVISYGVICTYRKGKYLYYEGDNTEYLYFLMEGSVNLYKWIDPDKKKLISEVMLGSWLAASELILNETYFFDSKTKSSVTCLKFPKSYLNKLLSITEINSSIINSLASWNQSYNSLLVNETCMTILKKYISESDTDIIMITQDKLSSILGYTRECINKNLKKLETNGLIRLERSKIIRL